MGDPQTTTWQEIGQFLGKAVVWLGYITIGVLAKLALDSRVNKLTRKEIVIKSVLSIFAGYLAAVLCEYYGYKDLGKIIVPVSTLLGESLVVYFITNWRKFLSKILPSWIFPESKKTDLEN